jgi:hypothetical protein
MDSISISSNHAKAMNTASSPSSEPAVANPDVFKSPIQVFALNGAQISDGGTRSDDIDWADEMFAAGKLDQYAGRYIAILDKRILGAADRGLGLELRDVVCRQCGVTVDRLLVYFVDGEGE